MNWNNNVSFADWKTSLRELLDDARKAVEQNDDRAVERVYGRIEQFIVASDDTVAGVTELDGVARETMRDLIVSAVKRDVKDIADRMADIAELEKRFANRSAVNSSTAAALRLERVRAALDHTTQTIASLRALSESLPTELGGDAAKIDQQIQDVIAALAKLGAAVQTKL